MPRRTSTILFYVVAAWCIAIGVFNQTIDNVDDLAWVAQALSDTDVSKFNPILAIWAHWIGMFLITAGVVLVLLIPTSSDSVKNTITTVILAVGTVGAQCFSVLSLGAFGAPVVALITVVACAVAALVFGLVAAGQSHRR